MANEKYQKIVDRLIDRTAKRQIEWKEGVNSGVFQVSFPNYSLILGQHDMVTGSFDYIISIIDADGNTIDTFSDIDLGGDYYPKMGELYQNARRQALGVDKALDEILDELDVPF
jgi:hypothetical protein